MRTLPYWMDVQAGLSLFWFYKSYCRFWRALALVMMYEKIFYSATRHLTHCILNKLAHTLYWKSPISILGMSGYEIYIFLEKNG